MTVSLREVTKDTVRAICKLAVNPDQQGYVAPNAISIAEAHFDPEHAWFRAIYSDDEPAGFAMLHIDRVQPYYYLWRYMIDAKFQGKGVGGEALKLIIAHVKTLPNANALYLSVVPGPRTPGPFYQRYGFVYTGAVEDGELVMRLPL